MENKFWIVFRIFSPRIPSFHLEGLWLPPVIPHVARHLHPISPNIRNVVLILLHMLLLPWFFVEHIILDSLLIYNPPHSNVLLSAELSFLVMLLKKF